MKSILKKVGTALLALLGLAALGYSVLTQDFRP